LPTAQKLIPTDAARATREMDAILGTITWACIATGGGYLTEKDSIAGMHAM
jgi:hypothetical protein